MEQGTLFVVQMSRISGELIFIFVGGGGAVEPEKGTNFHLIIITLGRAHPLTTLSNAGTHQLVRIDAGTLCLGDVVPEIHYGRRGRRPCNCHPKRTFWRRKRASPNVAKQSNVQHKFPSASYVSPLGLALSFTFPSALI